MESGGKEESGTLYLLVGYYSGFLYLVKVIRKEIKILKKYNKATESEGGFFSKTVSYLSGGSSSEYPQWQKTTVVKIKMYKKFPSYLFRNSILVIMSNIDCRMEDLQRKFEWMVSPSNTMARNSMHKLDKYFLFLGSDFKLIRYNEKCIVAFDATVSSYELTDSTLVVGTYGGMVLEFETESYNCLRRISTVIAIKNLTLHHNLLVLCLQDDNIQLIDLASNKFLNITGHQSFVSCAVSLKNTILVGGFDGYISATNPSKLKGWKKL